MLRRVPFLNTTYSTANYSELLGDASEIQRHLRSMRPMLKVHVSDDGEWIGFYHERYNNIPSTRAPHFAIYVRGDIIEIALNAEFKRPNLIIKQEIETDQFWSRLHILSSFRIRIVPKRIHLRCDSRPMANKGNYEWLFERPDYPEEQVYQNYPHYSRAIERILAARDREMRRIVHTLDNFNPENTTYQPTSFVEDKPVCDNAYFSFNILRGFESGITGRVIIDTLNQLCEMFDYLAVVRLRHNE